MTINILFSARDGLWRRYKTALDQAFKQVGLDVFLTREMRPEKVDYIVFAPNGPVTDFTPFIRCKGVLGLWAGVESIVENTTLTQPFTRMVDPSLTEGMVEWVTGHVLRYHLGLDADICRSDTKWQPQLPPLARDRRVGILGLGALGAACARALAGLNFDIAGWSRTPKNIEGVKTFNGKDGLTSLLQHSEILVLLLPLTEATENILNAQTFAQLPTGAFVINPGRGPLIEDQALLAALDQGQVSGATLDVFRIEPLPAEHPYWANDKVTVTPHIASETRPESASQVIAENVRRGEAGERFLNLVNRKNGY